VFEQGEVSTLRDFALGASTRTTAAVAVNCGETDDVDIVIPGENQLIFSSCLVRSRATGVAWRIPVFRLTTWVSDVDIAAGIAQVVVGFHAFAHIAAIEADDQPLARDHVVGVSLPKMSIEVKGPQRTPLNVLLPPGEYVAYLAGPDRLQVIFPVHFGQEDDGPIWLRPAPGPNARSI
jgi:hypothetical protein